MERRRFLGLGSTGLVVVGSGGLLAGCDPGPLPATPDSNGLLLSPGLTSRIVATTGEVVPGTNHVWHTSPDGGAVFDLPDGGWSYVSNSESLPGGAGFIRFDANGLVTDAGTALSGTIANCGGGATPWGTWLSGEEYWVGQIWECDPIGATAGVARPAMGRFKHEAAACDDENEVIYLTEDESDGALYRFRPDIWGDCSSGDLEVLTQPAADLVWTIVPDPSAGAGTTRTQVPDTVPFAGGEGIVVSDGRVVFTTKRDNRVWVYDIAANSLEVMYDLAVSPNAVLSGVDNVAATLRGTVFVAEDGGDMQIVLVRPDGTTFPVVQVTGVSGSEVTGPAFTSDGSRMYFSSQRNPGMTFEVSGSWQLL